MANLASNSVGIVKTKLLRFVKLQEDIDDLKQKIKLLESEQNEIEKAVMPVFSKGQLVAVNNIMFGMKISEKTSISYKNLFEKALTLLSKPKQEELMSYKQSITSTNRNRSLFYEKTESKKIISVN